MGGAVSAGEDNDELIDNLVEAEYIKTPSVERIFRAVDRGDYYIDGCKDNAYRDLAWKHGNIHLSAPCIYSEVMESLKFEPGMSFLNLGSGTGYLSTMAGLVLGIYGVNHGVELHDEVVDYAKTKLEEFEANSPAMDKYEFCPPNFVVGNCLLLDSSSHQYDRVYCGASCPSEHENYMKNLVRVGGILVMPLNDHLLQITRTGETTYEVKNVLPVSFASLVTPRASEIHKLVKLPEKNPLRLKEICRSVIRILLRASAEMENPTLRDQKTLIPTRRRRHKRRIRKVVIPVFDDRESGVRNGNVSRDEQTKRLYQEDHLCKEHSTSAGACSCAKKTMCNVENKKKPVPKHVPRSILTLDTTGRATSLDDTSVVQSSSDVRHRQGSVEDVGSASVREDDGSADVHLDVEVESVPQVLDRRSGNMRQEYAFERMHEDEFYQMMLEARAESNARLKNYILTNNAMPPSPTYNCDPPESGNQSISSSKTEEAKTDAVEASSFAIPLANGDSGIDNDNISDDSMTDLFEDDMAVAIAKPSTSRLTLRERSELYDAAEKARYEKFCKMYDDELAQGISQPQTEGKSCTGNVCRKAVVFKHIDYSDIDSDDLDDFESDSGKESFSKVYEGTREKSDLTCYTYLMRQKIGRLPLPQYLKMYLNFSKAV